MQNRYQQAYVGVRLFVMQIAGFIWSHTPYILLAMFMLGYSESFRWVFSVPKATHGFLKGLSLLVPGIIYVNRKKVHSPEYTGTYIILLFWLFSYALSALFSQSPGTSLLYMWYPWICCVLFSAISLFPFQKRHKNMFIWTATISVLATFFVGAYSVMFHSSLPTVLPLFFLEQRVDQLLKEVLFFGKCVGIGPYFMLIPIVVSLYLEKEFQKRWLPMIIITIISGIALAFMSNNRIDVLVVLIEVGIMFLFLPKKDRMISVAVLTCFCIAGLLLSQHYTGTNVVTRMLYPTSEDTDMVNDRFYYWKLAMVNFQSSPLVGVGPNVYNDVANFDYRRLYQQGVGNFLWRQYEPIGAHNIFFERLSDEGIIGFFAFILLLGYFLRADIAVFKYHIGTKKQYMLFSLASWSWVLYGLTDNGFGVQGMVTFFVIRGIMTKL